MYKEDLALNNLQLLICHETQPNKFTNRHTQTLVQLAGAVEYTDCISAVG